MAGCSGRVSRGTRTCRRRNRRPPRSQTTKQGWAGAGSECLWRALRAEPSSQQKRHKAAKDAEPPPDTLLPEREPRSGLPAPSPDFIPPFQEGAATDPAPNPRPYPTARPGTGRGWGDHNSVAAATRSGASTPGGGGGAEPSFGATTLA